MGSMIIPRADMNMDGFGNERGNRKIGRVKSERSGGGYVSPRLVLASAGICGGSVMVGREKAERPRVGTVKAVNVEAVKEVNPREEPTNEVEENKVPEPPSEIPVEKKDIEPTCSEVEEVVGKEVEKPVVKDEGVDISGSMPLFNQESESVGKRKRRRGRKHKHGF